MFSMFLLKYSELSTYKLKVFSKVSLPTPSLLNNNCWINTNDTFGSNERKCWHFDPYGVGGGLETTLYLL